MDATNAEAGPSTGPHRMRITSGGSVPNYVRFAKSFLLDNPDRPLVLHTITPEETAPKPKRGQSKSTSTLHSCTTTVPRLISVVERIKRELIHPHLVDRDPAAGKKGKAKQKASQIKGIWQYTQSGLMPAPPRVEDDVDPLVRVLEGNTRPKMTHRPYLQITLSTKALGLEKEQNVTCQYILTKHRNRGNKTNVVATGDGAEGDQTTAEPAGEERKDKPAARPTASASKRKSVDSQENGVRDKKRPKKVSGLAVEAT